MANSLRDQLAKKYSGSTGSTTTPTKTTSTNSLRASVIEKYSPKATLQPVTFKGTGSTAYKAGPTVAPADTRSVREKVSEKYSAPTAKSPAGVKLAEEEAKKKKESEAKNGVIASPEYFATSVDVRSEGGKFLKTFKGNNPGEAKAAAEKYAAEKKGYIQVTPAGGVFGRMFVRAQEALKGAAETFNQKTSKLGMELGGVMPNPDGGPNLVPDPTAGPLARTAAGVDSAVAGVSVLLSPLSAAFLAAEEIPVAGKPIQGINYIFGKAGEAGGWVARETVDSLPISNQAKDDIRPAAESLSTLLAELALGKAGVKGLEVSKAKTETLRNEIKVRMTKDIIETNQLPRKIYINPSAVRSIFVDEKLLTPEEVSLIKDLGLDGKGYRDAVKNGLSIEIPGEKIITIVDKPWFATAKGIFGITPESSKVVDAGGKPVKVPVTEEMRQSAKDGEKASPVSFEPVKNTPETLFTESITPSLLDRVNALTPEENSAFGKKIVESINEAIGISIDPAKADLPGNIKIIEQKSGDNRPAQFKNGQIEIFLPNLLEDIKSLAEGNQILAHEGEFSTVYKKSDGESIEELSTRYVRDIILHEAAHQKTMTLADQSTIKNLMSEVNAAKLSGKDNEVVAARKKLSDFMRTIEDKANAYMRDNREALEKEFLGGKQKETQTAIQRRINEKTGATKKDKQVVRSESSALKNRLKATARGAKEGFRAGKAAATDRLNKQGANKKLNEKDEATREKELGKLKQRILDRDRANKKEGKVRSMYETAIEKINDKAATVASRKAAAIDYAQILPFRERGKFLKAINNISSQKEFLNVIDRMSKASKAAERKVLITKISDELKGTIVKKRDGIPNVKFEIEAQRTLTEMRRLQKTMTYQEAQMAIANKIAAWQVENPDAAIPLDILREVEVLRTVGIKDQTVDELSYTLSAIQSLKETGRTKKEIELFNRETDIQMKKDKIYDIITGKQSLPSEKMSVKTREDKPGLVKSTKEFLTTYQYGWEEILDVFSVRDKSSLPYQSYLSKYAGNKVSDSFNKQNKGELTEIDKVSTSMKEIYGAKKNTEIMQILADIKEVRSLGDFKHNDGVVRQLDLSRGEAMQYYMWMQDETLLPTFTETLHWTPEIMDAVKGSLSAADIKMADSLINEFYPKYYESINAVYSKEYGVDLPFNPNYSPVHRAVDATIPENVLLAQESAKYATARNGSLKDRQNSTIDLKATDAFENLTRHIAKMEHYKAWSETMFEFRRIFADKEVRQAIKDIHGQGYLKVLDNFLNDFARDGVSREKIVTSVDTIRRNATQALLGLNIKTGIKQLSGVLSYGIELPTKDLFAGVADFWTDPIGKAKFLHDRSIGLQERFSDGYERDIKFAIEKGYDKKLAKANNLSEVMYILIRNADKFTVYQGSWAVYRSKYNEAKKLGKSDAEAEALGIREAEDITNRVQESSRLDTLAPIQRGGSLAKLFTMFAGQPNKYLRIMNSAGRNYKAGRQSGPVAARRVMWAWFVAPIVYNIIADMLIDEEYRDTPGGLVTRTLLGPLSYPLIVGQLFQQMYGWTQGENFVYQGTPAVAFTEDMRKSIMNFNTEDFVDGVTYLIDAMGKLSGIPSTILTRPIRDAAKEEEAAAGAGEAVSF